MRHLVTVLLALKEVTPAEQEGLHHDLDKHIEANRYRAPEICDWTAASKMLQLHLAGDEEIPWVDNLLRIWRDEPPLTLPETPEV